MFYRKEYLICTVLAVYALLASNCGNPSESSVVLDKDSASKADSALAKQLMQSESSNLFSISLTPEKTKFYLPALQAFTSASYNGLWIIIGGQSAGFHGTSNNPPPFLTTYANDSLWVIDATKGTSYGVPVPQAYLNALAVTNPLSYQAGNDLYLCGGYAVSDTSQTQLNTTSKSFFKINLPNLVAYVQSGGHSPDLSEVFPIALQDDFVRVAGGEMMVVNNNLYLIGGQDYEGTYSSGRTGKYTNAIRSFTLHQNGSTWSLANKHSLVDPVNLHRRDFNLVPYIASDNSLEAILYGGVFTPQDLSYNKPVYISGLSSGNPAIRVGTTDQKCNQYTCAVAPMYLYPGGPMCYSLLGGITYMTYNSDSGRLVVGDYIGNSNIPMPFSNLASTLVSDRNITLENVQIPPQPMLPGYIGSNAGFMPLSQFVANGYDHILDLEKIVAQASAPVKIGYMYGGILSNGPTSGTTPNGHVNTYANGTLYAVYFTLTEALANK